MFSPQTGSRHKIHDNNIWTDLLKWYWQWALHTSLWLERGPKHYIEESRAIPYSAHYDILSSMNIEQDILLVQDSWSQKLMNMERSLQNEAQEKSSLEAKLAAQQAVISELRASATTDQTDHVELMEIRAENEALKSKARPWICIRVLKTVLASEILISRLYWSWLLNTNHSLAISNTCIKD